MIKMSGLCIDRVVRQLISTTSSMLSELRFRNVFVSLPGRWRRCIGLQDIYFDSRNRPCQRGLRASDCSWLNAFPKVPYSLYSP